jgi:Ca2+-binding EF-hand superfamily protein
MLKAGKEEKEPPVKLNKDSIEAAFSQIEYLKPCKKEHIQGLCKLFDSKISSDDIDEFEKLFRTFDSEEQNQMPQSQLGTALRILQQLPTENELNQLIEVVNPKKPEGEGAKEKKKSAKGNKSAGKSANGGKKGKEGKKGGKKGKGGKEGGGGDEDEPEVIMIDFFKFLHALALYMRDPNEIADEIKKAFRVLDRQKQGYIMSVDLREFLSKLGDPLLDDEIDEMIKLADSENNGQINYEEFVDMMTNMKPGKKKKGKKGKKGGKKKKK